MKTTIFLFLSLFMTTQAYALGDQAALATDPQADSYFQRFNGNFITRQRGTPYLESIAKFRYLGNGLATIQVRAFGGLTYTSFYQCHLRSATCTMMERGTKCLNILFHFLPDGSLIARSECNNNVGINEYFPWQGPAIL